MWFGLSVIFFFSPSPPLPERIDYCRWSAKLYCLKCHWRWMNGKDQRNIVFNEATPFVVFQTHAFYTLGSLDEVCLLWCVSPPFSLTPVWIFPFGSVRFQNGSFCRRSAHSLWRRRRERCAGLRERGSPGWWRSGWPEDVQAVDGPESPDHGHLQPEPRQTKLLHCQPLPLHLPRGQSHPEVCKANNRVAISFPSSSTHTAGAPGAYNPCVLAWQPRIGVWNAGRHRCLRVLSWGQAVFCTMSRALV